MRPISFIPLFSSCVSTLVLQPLITPAPQLAVRDAAPNICGYYTFSGLSLTETISCDIGTPCLIATNLSPAVGYCSDTDNAPLTSIYPYGSWPSDEGCGPGEACCPLLTPAVGKYLFNGGSTVFLGCGSTSFALNAFFATPLPSLISAAKPTSTAARTTSSTPNFGLTTSPALDSTATPATPRPTQTSTSSSGTSSTTLIVVIVGAVVALISGIIFLVFLYMAWKVHHKAKYPPQQPQFPYQYSSNPSLNSVPQVKEKKSGLGKWSKIVTIISPIFAIAGVIVSVYFGLRQK